MILVKNYPSFFSAVCPHAPQQIFLSRGPILFPCMHLTRQENLEDPKKDKKIFGEEKIKIKTKKQENMTPVSTITLTLNCHGRF